MIGLIPAAGKGVRFKELGKHYSKTILPYKEKPILIHQIEWLEKHGCTEIIVVLNHQEDIVKDILKLYNKNVIIKRQEEQNGLSGAVLSGLPDSADNVLILLGDLIVTDDITEEMFHHNFISVKEVPDYSRWCMVEVDEKNKVKTFIDKPKERPNTNISVSGVYHLLNASILKVELESQIKNNIKISGEFQLSTVLYNYSKKFSMYTVNLNMIDFGTLEEYLQNRSVKNSRSFNEINIDGQFIIKTSELEREKIIKEYNWFNNLPEEIAVFTPRIFNKDFFEKKTWYKMEKILAPSLREIYLFLDSSEETWNDIFNAIFKTLDLMESYGQRNTFMKSVIEKTKYRVSDLDIPVENKLINNFIKELEYNIEKYNRPSLMHGDFCFSNLLYDFQGSCIKMIDPRGDLFGDHYYEVAKIMHSVIYDYDFVDAELYVKYDTEYKLYNNGKYGIKNVFLEKLKHRYSYEEINYIKLLTASLFLSMIPLHSHNRNNQLIYYSIFKEIYKDNNEI